MKSIIITGAGSGIGKATALRLAKAGWYVGLFDVNRPALEDVQSQLNGENCHLQVVDVTNGEEMKAAFAEFVDRVGHLDALFNCAGIMPGGHFEDIPLEKHYQMIDINIKGVLHGFYFGLPYLKQSSDARVISMSSASSIYGIPSLANYSASKFWVKGMTQSLNIEWKRHGIHVTDIEPPFVRTPLLNGHEQARIVETLGVNLHAEDIANKVYKALNNKRMHHPVSFKYRFLRVFSRLLPEFVSRILIRQMAGY